MGIDMATINAPFGLMPWGNVLEAHMYCLKDTVETSIYHGDLMEHGGTTLLTPTYGQLIEAVREAEGAAGSILGAVLEIFDVDGDPILYMDDATVGNGTIAGYVLLADHPLQQFIAQEDGDTGSLQIADMGIVCKMIGTGVGDNVTGLSSMMIDGNGGTGTPAVHLIAPHPDDTISAAGAASNYCRFICELVTHYRAGARSAI